MYYSETAHFNVNEDVFEIPTPQKITQDLSKRDLAHPYMLANSDKFEEKELKLMRLQESVIKI